ncbi:MAG: nucleoside triphosphate pyrophosphohydrolase [Dehalococcoidia bacterium]|nr:nucleoside triphosphate pyrophosphohydrolase [Dehalococcoidia bacterium]
MTEQQDLGTFEALRNTLRHLRGPQGCPWDREQTHASLRRTLLEECYETLEALDQGEHEALAEELGDLLLQVAFHCQIAEERGEFTYEAVFRHINEKLVRRHPHVFGTATAESPRAVEEQWEAIKEQERGGRKSLLDGVASATPALAEAQAVSQRAVRAGFEWDSFQDVAAKVAEELQELARAATPAEREREMGDVLFTMVNVARWMELDAESALRGASRRFGRRFRHMEQAALEQGTTFTKLAMAQKEALWQQAKRALANEER